MGKFQNIPENPVRTLNSTRVKIRACDWLVYKIVYFSSVVCGTFSSKCPATHFKAGFYADWLVIH